MRIYKSFDLIITSWRYKNKCPVHSSARLSEIKPEDNFYCTHKKRLVFSIADIAFNLFMGFFLFSLSFVEDNKKMHFTCKFLCFARKIFYYVDVFVMKNWFTNQIDKITWEIAIFYVWKINVSECYLFYQELSSIASSFSSSIYMRKKLWLLTFVREKSE